MASSSCLPCVRKRKPSYTNSLLMENDSEKPCSQRKPQGWKVMPFIIGNETFERLGSYGLTANLQVYLMEQYHMDVVQVALLLTTISTVQNLVPLFGAFVSDACLGKYLTIAIASVANLIGMVLLIVTAVAQKLRPAGVCPDEKRVRHQCIPASKFQLGFFILSQVWLIIGSAGIRPCSIPFSVEQFDSTTEKGRELIRRFFNWYYTSFAFIMLVCVTLVIYIQNISWVWGFAIPTICMIIGIVLFFLGTPLYVFDKPEGSIFSSILQVFTAAYKKRHLKLPVDGAELYDSELEPTVSKLTHTNQYRFLDKAAILENNGLISGSSPFNRCRLCSIQQVEEVKSIFRIMAIWATSIIPQVAMFQQGQFFTEQAKLMDRRMIRGHNYQIPVGSVVVLGYLTIAINLPLYDCLLVPFLQKFTKREGGITPLQRIGLGNILSIVSSMVTGYIEKKRRDFAISHGYNVGPAPFSVFWLAPQFFIMGLYDVFALIGLMELYNRQFPQKMKSIGNALTFLAQALANYLGTLLIMAGQHIGGNRPWLNGNLNLARMDYYFYLIAAMGVVNFVFYLFCMQQYHYKENEIKGAQAYVDIENEPSIINEDSIRT